MAAPPTLVRGTPAGVKFENGYRCVKAFSGALIVGFFEIETGIPGWDGGDAIDTTTQHNSAVRTMAPRALMMMTEHTVKCALASGSIAEARSLINRRGSVTDLFPDGSTYDYYAYLRKIEFDPFVEGTMPTCTLTVMPTNYDPTNRVEALPVFTDVLGT